MKIRYGKTKDYKNNRAKKIARNKSRRNDYSGRFRSSNSNISSGKSRKLAQSNIPKEIELLSNGISFSKSKYTFNAPKELHLTNNPEETLNFISMIAASLKDSSNTIDLAINFNNTVSIDIGSLSIIDDIIVKGMEYIGRTNRSIYVHGTGPYKDEAAIIFAFSGLPKVFRNINENVYPFIVTLDPLATDNTTSSETDRIIKYYDCCLNKVNYHLNEKGIRLFNELINEIVDNAIIHSSNNNPIYLSGGFFDSNTSKGQLSIISFGKTFYESLSSENTSSDIIEKVKKLVEQHKKIGYMDFDEENIWTISCLQSGVSCKRSEIEKDRGCGTVKFIETFSLLGKTSNDLSPIMSLISGKTHIVFDGKYKMKENDKGHQIIAFNKNNSLKEKPDPKYVKRMKTHFPGVIINIEFYIDRKYLSKFERKNNEHEEN